MKEKILLLLILYFMVLLPGRSQVSLGGDYGIDYSRPKEYTIGGIVISGVKYLDNNVLIMLSGLSVGDKIKIPGDKMADAVKKLWDQGLFEDVQIYVDRIVDNDIFLNIALKERPRLSRFSFNGIKKSDADNIREKIKLVKGDYITDNLIDPRHNTLEYIAERKVASGFRGLVAAGHCCALSALDEPAARRVIEKVAAAQLHVITLPACNMYLMGRQDRGLVRRGLTRVGELLAAGVNVACASDNIRDHFNPFGDADMLQVALIAALALHTGTPTGLEAILGMATERPARILRLADYGLRVGGMASFVVLDAPDAGGAIAALAPRSRVFSQGRLVARTDVSEELL